jgi:MFS family permease
LLPALWALIPLYNVFRFARVPLLPPVAEEHKTPIRSLLRTNIFVIAMLLMVTAGASELTMSQWSSLFAEVGLGVPKVVGDLLGPALFALLMGIGRTIYGVWGHKIHLKGALLGSAILCVACYAVTVFAPIPVLSLAGCALCGLSVALMWPGTFSLTAASFPLGGTAMFGILAICGDLGAATGPWLAGVTSDWALNAPTLLALGAANGLAADQVGLRFGLFVAMIFPIAAIIGLLLWKEKVVTAEPVIAPTS